MKQNSKPERLLRKSFKNVCKFKENILKCFENIEKICGTLEKNLINLGKEYIGMLKTSLQSFEECLKILRGFVQFENTSRKH